jgi:hypothetical protein
MTCSYKGDRVIVQTGNGTSQRDHEARASQSPRKTSSYVVDVPTSRVQYDPTDHERLWKT